MPTTLAPAPAELLARFEALYAQAEQGGGRASIPWDRDAPHPLLVSWLDGSAPAVVRCGCRVAVVGCGRGHDAAELLRRGYDVTAFDCSPTAIHLAKARDPDNAQCYFRADLFDPPARWRHRFDLVVEVRTIQSLPPGHQPAAVDALARLVGANGHLLVIAHAIERAPADADGPPWPATEAQLRDLADGAGLEVESFERLPSETRPAGDLRATFGRRV